MEDSEPNLSTLKSTSWIAFLSSVTFHTSLLLVCALVLTGGFGSGDGGGGGRLLVDSSSGSGEDIGDDLGTELDSLDAASLNLSSLSLPALEVSVPELTTELAPSISISDKTVSSATLSDVVSNAIKSSSSSDIGFGGGTGAGVGSGGGYGLGDGMGGAGTANFFGAEARGRRLVFIVDSSISMFGSRWEALTYELKRSLSSLYKDQEFFVIAFDSQPHPMFGEFPPRGKFLKPGEDSTYRVIRWLRSLELGSNTLPATSISIALEMKPDAIFLLSDGELMDDTVERLRFHYRSLKELQQSQSTYDVMIPIHTILLESSVGFQTLETISKESGGTFTPVHLKDLKVRPF